MNPIYWLEDSIDEPAYQLALDHLLIDGTERPHSPTPVECLRWWEFSSFVVIVGRGSKLDEVDLDQCQRDRVPVLRRCSGGASVVAGPGCKMYSVLLSLVTNPELRSIDNAHRFVMAKCLEATKPFSNDVELKGICDLVVDNKKISGNALRYKRDWLLYHGTFLYDFPLELISRYLKTPPRQPEYRQSRSHQDFVANLSCDPVQLKQNLKNSWQATLDWRQSAYLNSSVAKSNELNGVEVTYDGSA